MEKCKPFCKELKLYGRLEKTKDNKTPGIYKCEICGYEKIIQFKNG